MAHPCRSSEKAKDNFFPFINFEFEDEGEGGKV